jgi:replicative DNA helicase
LRHFFTFNFWSFPMAVPFQLSNEFVSPETELALLAAIVANPDMYFQVISHLSESSFAAYPNDFLAVANAIEDRRPLPIFDNLPGPHPDPEGAAKHLSDLMQKRLMADHAQQFLKDLRSEKSAADLKMQLEQNFTEVEQSARHLKSGNLTSIPDLMPVILQGLNERFQRAQVSGGGIAGLSTGLPSLDSITGGLQDYLFFIAAPPGMGKTSFALALSRTVARAGGFALYVSHEEAITRLAGKTIAASADLEYQRFESGMSDPCILEEAARIHAPALRNLFFLEGTNKTTINEISATYLRAKNKTGCSGTGLLIIDYFQKAAASLGSGDFRHVLDSYLEQVYEVLIRKNNACVLMLSAQNRSGQGTGSISSIRDSGDYAGDIIGCFVNSDRASYHPNVAVDLVIGKNRRGQAGVSVKLNFNQALGQFTEATEN